MILSADVRSECISQVPPDAFYVPANRIVFDAIRELDQSEPAFDFLLLKKRLVDTGQLEEVGGIEGLCLLWSFVPTPDNWQGENWQYHVKLVKENFQRRNMIFQMQALIAQLHDPQVEFEATLREHVGKILIRFVFDISKVEKTFKEHVLDPPEQIKARAPSQGSAESFRA